MTANQRCPAAFYLLTIGRLGLTIAGIREQQQDGTTRSCSSQKPRLTNTIDFETQEDHKVKNTLFIAAALFLAGCASEPTIQTGPDAEVTFDGLHVVDNSAFKAAWADPDIDFSRYNKFIAGGAFFEFRAVKKTASTMRHTSSQDEFWIDDKSKAKLEEEVGKVFSEELAKSERFTETDTPGPDVLIIRGGLHDIVSRVPPEMVGRGDIYLRSVGEATLVLEIVDSLSGEVIARAIERRAAEQPGGQMVRSNTVTTWSEVRRLARTWATRLRKGLDSIPTE
jgi:hypothetical protein